MTNSTRPNASFHNIETDEVTIREMNNAEFAEYQTRQAAEIAAALATEAATTQKAALLARLGITADEATLLLS